ncbi:histone-like nucleoid-structuring protein Lsr2 [Streptomyces beijiangensis]|uniref:Lsr2 family protein n=1 Tax=Streptomyces beijiangensis TaxID=163361 RepID=A0A939JI79_9ACTN|nr:Lsr2 family protein [Streptomyces beijiangensis]MBO0515238.1 Lsr2 family protein [Streptomyces beijiangensis]
MAQKIITRYIDDLSGKEGDDVQTHRISLDSIGREIDLSAENYDKLLTLLGPYLDAGRKMGASGQIKRGPARAGAAGGNQDTAEIRAWAKKNGYNVNDRGRVSLEIRTAYNASK